MSRAAILERDRELARVDALLESARAGAGGVLVVEGPAGIGKTRLLAEAECRARGSEMQVLAARGSELERGYPFGLARQLLEPTVRAAAPERRAVLLEGAARLAAPAIGIDGPPQGAGAVDRDPAEYALVHGLYWLVANLSAERALLLVVDDLQWVDAASQRAIAYLARRLAGLRLALMTAQRPAVPGEERVVAEAIAAVPGTELLRPAALTEEAVGQMIAAGFGVRPSGEFVRACHAATGGNALLVEEVVADFKASHGRPDDTAARRMAHLGPERVAVGVQRRVGALPVGAGALAQAIAVLGDGCALELAGTLAGLDHVETVEAATALGAVDVLADGLPLRFRHPVVRAAVADSLPVIQSAALHADSARLLADRGAPAATVAAHLLHAPAAGDARVIEPLRAAAREARAQGLPDRAVAHLRRALAEPPPPEQRVEVLHELGSAELAAVLPEGPDRLRSVLELLPDPVERAAVSLELGGSLHERMAASEAADVGRRALAELAGADRELSLRLLTLVAECVRMDRRVGGDEDEQLRRRARTLTGATLAERIALAVAAMMSGGETAADHAAAAELLERSLRGGPLPPGSPETGIVSNLLRAGHLGLAGALIERWLEEARTGGLVHKRALMLGMRGWLELERGRLAEAEVDLQGALELTAELAIPAGVQAALLAVVLAEQGRLEGAAAVLRDHGLTGRLPEHQVMNVALFLRARVRLAQGRRDEALEDSLEVGRRYAAWGIRRAVPPWRSQAAILLHARGERRQARRLVEEELELAERWGTPLAIGLALRGAGLVTGDVDRLQSAVEALAASPSSLELARARIDLGSALRRAGQRSRAREPLSVGMDEAHGCGAAPLAERAREELRALGARPRRLALSGVQALTASERRVARLAAQGLTNRAIAQELFVTTATVETHLRHVFQKLHLRSRGELGAVLADPPGARAQSSGSRS